MSLDRVSNSSSDYNYYTFQSAYTFDKLSLDGKFSSEIDNHYFLINLVKHHFNASGIVYYFKVSKSYTGELPVSGRGCHLLKLDGDSMPKERIEFVGNKFSKAMMLCDALCHNNFVDATNQPESLLFSRLCDNFGVDFEFFVNFGAGTSDVYVGLVSHINSTDVLEVIKNYRK